jgi:hypothetical protein
MIAAICSQSRKRWLSLLLRAATVAMLSSGSGYAQSTPTGGEVFTPGSSIEKPSDTGVRAHTNIQLFIPNRAPQGPPSPSRSGEGDAVEHRPLAPLTAGAGGTIRPQ